jgi:hypothetical protein
MALLDRLSMSETSPAATLPIAGNGIDNRQPRGARALPSPQGIRLASDDLVAADEERSMLMEVAQ